MRVNRRLPVALLVAALSVAALAGCASSAVDTGAGSSSTSSATETNPYGGAAVDPLGADEPVLTLLGGSAGTVELTLAQLEELGTTTVTVDEPFVKKQQSFTGVPVSAIFDRAGIPSTAKVDTIALNDYEYAAVAGDLEGSAGMIATQRDGTPIPYDQGGPIRLVYPDGSPLSGILDAWNWSLKSIAVSSSS